MWKLALLLWSTVVSTEDIEIDYYSSAKIEVKDGKTGAPQACMIF